MDSSSERRETTLPFLTALAALSYFIGFIVSNGFYGQFQLLELESFRAHYLVAAMLFGITTGVPVAAVLLMNRQIAAYWAGPAARFPRGRRIVLGTLYMSFLLVGVYLAWIIVMAATAVGDIRDWWRAAVLYPLLVVTAIWLVQHIRKRVLFGNTEVAQRHFDISDFHQVLMVCAALLSFASIYGLLVYPYIRPQYGGGATWIADVLDREERVVQASTLGRVAIVSRDDHSVRLIVCAEDPNGRSARRLDIGRTTLGDLRLVRVEALPTFLRKCRDGTTL